MRRVLHACAVALALALPAHAAEEERPPGSWAPWREAGTTAGVPPAAVPVLRGHAERVLGAFFRAVPELATPDDGWWGLRSRYVAPSDHAPGVMTAGLFASVIRASEDGQGRRRFVAGEARRSIGIESEINSLACVLGSGAPVFEDAQGAIWSAPELSGEVGGFPVYRGDCLAITARTAPLFTPATRGRVAAILLARARATLADFDRGMAEARAAGVPQAAAELKDARDTQARTVAQWAGVIARMTPDERQTPAHLRADALLPEGAADPFADAPGEAITSLVVINPAFFDRAAPAGLQLITVHLTETGPLRCDHAVCEPADQALFAKIAEHMDWNALAALTR